jgi:hypothetical protein
MGIGSLRTQKVVKNECNGRVVQGGLRCQSVVARLCLGGMLQFGWWKRRRKSPQMNTDKGTHKTNNENEKKGKRRK